MPEQFLDCAQIGTAFEQMGRGRVPKTVWPEVGCTRDRAEPVVDHPPNRSGIDAPTAKAEQYGRSAVRRSQSRPSPHQPGLKRDISRKPVRHGAFFGPLAQHPEHPPTPIHVTSVQSDELADPNTRGVEQLDDQPVPEFECLVSWSCVHRAGLVLGH